MIKEIQSFIILDNNGAPIFVQENFIQGRNNVDLALLSDFINALQNFATELGEKETKFIELGGGKIFSTKDSSTNYLFVLKCDKKAKAKKMYQILNEIKNLFLNKFLGHLYEIKEEKNKELLSSFENELKIILNPYNKLEGLFKP